MISDIYRTYVQCAQGIPGFVIGQKENVPYDITELANEYCKACDNNDEVKKSQYISALMVRYWYMVSWTYKQSRFTRLEVDDIASWIYEAIEKAAANRAWLDKSKQVGKDPKGAEKVINRCIYSVCQYWYKYYNAMQRKAKITSLNVPSAKDTGHSRTKPEEMIDTIVGDEDVMDTSRDLVQSYIDRHKVVQAIILDHIMYQDSFITKSKQVNTGEVDEDGKPVIITEYHYTYSPAKLTKSLRAMDNRYIDYFVDKYIVTEDEVVEAIHSLLSISRQAVSDKIKRLLNRIKNNYKEMRWLCS